MMFHKPVGETNPRHFYEREKHTTSKQKEGEGSDSLMSHQRLREFYEAK